MKYIITRNANGLETALIFPNHIPHINMAGDTLREIGYKGGGNYPCPKLGVVVSAGFISFVGLANELVCDGASDSLQLESRPEDTDIVIAELNQRPYHTDALAWPKKENKEDE